MTKRDDIKVLLNRLSVLFGPPETPDPRAFIVEYESILVKYSPALVSKAGDYIRDNHLRRGWPTCAELRAALMAVAPPPKPIDWDAVERERKEGWKLSDLSKNEAFEASKARVREMVAEMKRNIASKRVEDAVDPLETDWRRGQRDAFEEMQRNSQNKAMHMTKEGIAKLTERSRRMSGDDE